ncbi:MAG: DsrE family protein, partial [Myxococcales bacterium]|nr:DsrE family protein [Myxococcales bacterium]
LVFVANTGLEDAQTLSSVFRHAKAAADTGRLREVVVLVYGRAIAAFDGESSRRPPELLERIRDARDAGVRILLCANALASSGIARESVDPAPTEIVPHAIGTLVEYVARGAAVIRY